MIFRSERFLENPGLDKYLIAFSKGSKQCISINLAHAELYLALALISRRYGSTFVRGQRDLRALSL